jgi:hypothetical protein
MPPCKRIEEKQHLLAQVAGRWTLDAACVCVSVWLTTAWPALTSLQ